MKHKLDTTMNTSKSSLSKFLGLFSKAAIILFVACASFYLVLVFLLKRNLESKAISISQAAGLPAEVEQTLGGILLWILAFALLPALIGLVKEAMNPFKTTASIFRKIALVFAIALGLAFMPSTLRTIRGVDQGGLPTVMKEVNPANARWFAPDGSAVIFISIEHDGTRLFWNRPGKTPYSASDSNPATRADRLRWEQKLLDKTNNAAQLEQRKLEDARKHNEQQGETEKLIVIAQTNQQIALQAEQQIKELRKSVEQSRITSSQSQKMRADEVTRRLQHHQQNLDYARTKGVERGMLDDNDSTSAIKKSQAPSESKSHTTSRPLYRGKVLRQGIHGASVMIWSNGPIIFQADGGRKVRVPAGRRLRVNSPNTLYAQPLSAEATRFYFERITTPQTPPRSTDTRMLVNDVRRRLND